MGLMEIVFYLALVSAFATLFIGLGTLFSEAFGEAVKVFFSKSNPRV